MEGAVALVVDAGKFAVAKSIGGWEFSIGLKPATGPSVDFGPIVDCSEPGDVVLAESEPGNSDYLASGLPPGHGDYRHGRPVRTGTQVFGFRPGRGPLFRTKNDPNADSFTVSPR
jgi:hypothetical protein